MVAGMEWNNGRFVKFDLEEADPETELPIPDTLSLKRLVCTFFSATTKSGHGSKWHVCPESAQRNECAEAKRISLKLECMRCKKQFRSEFACYEHLKRCYVINWMEASLEMKGKFPKAEDLFEKSLFRTGLVEDLDN